MADEVEVERLGSATCVLDPAKTLLDEPGVGKRELRFAGGAAG
ncbi:hypothetical protein AB0C70_36000 [Streptomyces sp. NPDC048564]